MSHEPFLSFSVFLVLISTISACSDPASAASSSGGGGSGSGEPPVPARATEVRRLLQGDFDSSAQSTEQFSYFPIRLRTCRVDAPELGDEVLYIEQAMMDALDAPYRQRLYVIQPSSAEGEDAGDTVASHVLELRDPDQWIGACEAAETPTATASDAIAREGCEVHLTRTGDLAFEGSTSGHGCKSSLKGASYATSEVTLGVDGLRSWDRGFDATDTQVWGAVDGPYRFDRKTSLPAD